MELQSTPEVKVGCGDNVTLTCDTISAQALDIKLFAWLGRNNSLCDYNNVNQNYPGVLCERTSERPNHRLTLTLINVMPDHQGKYLCKLRSQMGVKQTITNVTVGGELAWFVIINIVICQASSSKQFLIFTACLRSQVPNVKSSTESCSSGVKPEWICLMVEIMMVKFMM